MGIFHAKGFTPGCSGGPCRGRTDDLLGVNQLLYQLS